MGSTTLATLRGVLAKSSRSIAELRRIYGGRTRTSAQVSSPESGTSQNEDKVRERLASVIPSQSPVSPEEQARLIAAELKRLRSFQPSPRDGGRPTREREH